VTGISAIDKFLGVRGGNPQWVPIIEVVKFKGIVVMTFPLCGSIILNLLSGENQFVI